MSPEVKESASAEELEKIIGLRYRILREPWQQPFETSRDELEDQSVNAFIADDKGNAIACGRLQRNSADTGQIRYMAVDERYRGKGLGKQILKYLEKRALKMHMQKVQLQARENALDFYKHQGYMVVERSFLLWGKIQHYLMEKKI